MFRDFETRSFGQLSLIIGRISSAAATNVLIRNSVADRSVPDRMASNASNDKHNSVQHFWD